MKRPLYIILCAKRDVFGGDGRVSPRRQPLTGSSQRRYERRFLIGKLFAFPRPVDYRRAERRTARFPHFVLRSVSAVIFRLLINLQNYAPTHPVRYIKSLVNTT